MTRMDSKCKLTWHVQPTAWTSSQFVHVRSACGELDRESCIGVCGASVLDNASIEGNGVHGFLPGFILNTLHHEKHAHVSRRAGASANTICRPDPLAAAFRRRDAPLMTT